MTVLPKQRTAKKDKKWRKDTVDYWIDRSLFHGQSYSEMTMLFRAAEGQLNPIDYKYILNPYNTDDERLTKFPSKLRNYDIIQPILELFLGENTKKPLNMQVVAENEDSKNVYLEGLQEKVRGMLAQQAINALNKAGIQTGIEDQEVPDIQKFIDEYSENWKDDRAVMGQEALNYIKRYNELDEKAQQALYYWLVTGRVFSYRNVRGDEVVYDIPNPIDIWYLKSDNSEFIEDGMAVVRKRRMLLSSIIDEFKGKWELSKEDMDFIETQLEGTTSTEPSGYVHLTNDNMDSVRYNYGYYNGGYTDVFHVNWTAFREIKILTYIDPLGQEQELEVEKEYKLDEAHGDISLTSEWEIETWEGYRIGDRIYAKEVAAPTISQTDKLLYNGRCETTLSGELNSIVKRGLVYQALVNVYHYRRELTINRNKDKIALLPLGLIPSKFGKDPVEKFMYYMEANSVAWFDETKSNAPSVMQALKTLDMNLYQYLKSMTEVINDVKSEFWDAIGVNRQRYGESTASDGKAVTEQAIFRSAIISAERNRKFYKFMERDHQQFLDLSQHAWVNGKRGAYVGGDGRLMHLDIDPEKYCNAKLGVFAVNADIEQEKLKTLKDYSFSIAQKSANPSAQVVVAETLDAENFATVKGIIKKMAKIEQAQLDAENQANRAVQENATKVAAQTAADNRDMQKYVADKQYDAVVDAASIRAGASGGDGDGDGSDSTGDITGQQKLDFDREKLYVGVGVDREKMRSAEKMKDKEIKARPKAK